MAHYPGLRCGRVLDPNVARPLSRAATVIDVRAPGTFSSFVAARRPMSYSCRRAASGSIRDARLAGAYPARIAALRRTTPASARVPGSLRWVSDRNDLTSWHAIRSAGKLGAGPTVA